VSNEEDRLARAVIDDAFTAMLAESRADVAVREVAVDAARRRMNILAGKQKRWRERDVFDPVVGMRATAMAASADMAETDVPPGVHLRALTAYLESHDVVEPPLPSPAPDRRGDADTADPARGARAGWGRRSRGSRRR